MKDFNYTGTYERDCPNCGHTFVQRVNSYGPVPVDTFHVCADDMGWVWTPWGGWEPVQTRQDDTFVPTYVTVESPNYRKGN